MPTVTKDDFLRCLRASQVVDESDVDKILSEAATEDARKLALHFVEAGLLTRWQAKYLMGGRHILTIGNYRLLERLGRHEIYGDRFRAVHLQLGRKVQLQILPTTLNQDDDRRERFMVKATAAANLDHPNLIHVYDIDREGGRLILVSELVEGTGLDEYPIEELSDVDVARIVKQTVTGLREAHKEGIVHGQIELKNLLITPDEYVKIKHLVLSSLDEIVVQTMPQDDINSIGKIGVQLLATTAHTAGPKPKKQLYDLISWLSTTNEDGLEQILPKLDEWINVFNSATSNSISGISPQGLTAPSSKALTDTADTANPANPQPQKNPKSTTQTPRKPNTDTEPPAPIAKPPKKVSPATLVTTMIVGGLMLVGGVAGFAWIMNGDNADKTKNVKKVESRKSPDDSQRKKKDKEKEKLDTKPTQLDPSSQGLDEMLAAGTGQEPNREPLVQASQSGAEEQTSEQPSDINGDEATTKPSDSRSTDPVENTTTSSAKPTEVAGTENKTDTNTKTTQESQNSASPSTASEPEDSNKAVAAATPKTPIGNADKPFANFPSSTMLPDVTTADEVPIGPIAAPKNYLLTAELLAGPEICKAKISFELNRDPADKQRWLVNFRRRKTDEPIAVAAFRFDGTTMHFQWLPAAAEEDYAQHLRNCQVKFTAKQEFGFVTLRSPVQIEGFQITEDDLTVDLETEVKWLPDPDNLVIEIQPFKYGEIAAKLVNRTVDKRKPAMIFFSEKKNQQFVWLEVTASTRKQLELSLDMKFGIPNFRVNRSAIKRLEKLGNDLKTKADFASAEYDRIKDLNTPEGISYDDWRARKSSMKSAADDAQSLASDTIELTTNLKSLFGKPIPLVVYFEMNGNRIVLAESKAAE